MNTPSMEAGPARTYELRFAELFNTGRGYAFPCDAQGNVDIAMLSERARKNYLRARATVGRDFFAPVMCTRDAVGSCYA